MEDNIQIITIPVHTGMDASQLLDIAIELASHLTREIEAYGEEGYVLEEEVSVEDDDALLGGE
jgi:hypothetical protein